MQGLGKNSFKDKDALEICLSKVSQIKEEEKKWEEYDRAIERLEYAIDTIKKSTEDIDEIGDEDLKDKYITAQSSFKQEQRSLTDNETIIENLTKLKDKVDECDAEIKELEDNHLSLINLSNAFNGREGSQRVGLETFALRKMFELVLAAANKRLNMMTRRYQLEIKSETKGAAQQGLDISVSDIFTGRTRSIQTLSGGETFMASLSLALGLSDIAQSSSKKNIRLDTIFIDEGFGSLDSENGFGTLGDVLNTLQDNIASSRAVGLVSHVDTVKNAVPAGFYIEKTPSGSHVKLMLE